MCDDWENEDWENAEYTIPVLNVPNPEQLKRLEERKLIEESDLANAKDLFKLNDDEIDLTLKEIKDLNKRPNNFQVKKPKREKTVSNQKANEEKQKELAKIRKEQKAKKERENELYGDTIDDEYADYEDKFY